jgi:ABC-type sulfate/molybdate transport systems ATPase subunit
MTTLFKLKRRGFFRHSLDDYFFGKVSVFCLFLRSTHCRSVALFAFKYLAKWLAVKPVILLLDEPTAGVDIGSKTEIVEIIRGFADQGNGVIIISPEPAELLALSDRILIMAGGRIVREISSFEIEGWAVSGTDPAHRISSMEKGLQVAIQQEQR